MKLVKLIKAVEPPFGSVWTVVLKSEGFTFSRTLWPAWVGKPVPSKIAQMLDSITTFHGLEGVLQHIRENPHWVKRSQP